jgi:pimeloyl-ACP methyl ester carboxylesterase
MRYVYLHGFASGPTSRKAQYFATRLRERAINLEIPDLSGGDFEHLTITGQLAIVERLLDGEGACLIGSSMGGYLAALYASRYAGISRVVLLAPAFGFARRWPEALGEEAYTNWKTTGWLPFFHYVDNLDRRVHFGLIEDGLRYEDYPQVTQPGLVFHGTDDQVVPLEFSQEFARLNPNVDLRVVDSGHELTDQLEYLWTESRAFLLE